MKIFRSGFVLTLASLALASHAAFYDFESVALGAATPLSLTDDGVTALFTSSPTEGSFEIADASDPGLELTTLTGRILVEPTVTSSLLTIAFDQPLGAFSTFFATSSDDPIELNAYSGATLVGTVVVLGVVPVGGDFREGQVGFGGTLFDRVTLQTQGVEEAFGIDNVTVRPVPEPATMAALGLGALALIRRRKA